MFKNFFKKRIKAAMDEVIAERNQGTFTPITSSSGLDDTYLFDFLNLQSGYGGFPTTQAMFAPDVPTAGGVSNSPFIFGAATDGNGVSHIMTVDNAALKNAKVALKPIEVLHELERRPKRMELTLLDEKIEILKHKEKLITQVYAKREVTALIQRMENRKKYDQYKEFFELWDDTDDEKIDKLLKAHSLVMKVADLFIPEFPDVAITRMKEYTDKVMEICEKKPVFYVIAEDKNFKKLVQKRDPILLVQSPFGFFWQILGAWDAEMLLLSEL